MAKLKKSAKEKKSTGAAGLRDKSFLDRLEEPKYILGFFVLLFIVLAILYKPLVFEGKEPGGSDIVSGIGKTHQVKMWEEKTGHKPLWNPYMFGGMPMYQRFGPEVWSVDTLLNHLSFLGDWRLWFFLAGALGMFLLAKFLGLSAAVGMLASLAFILMPHFQALIIVGHFAKFRALMWMPYVLLTALYLLKKRSVLSGLLFALALALQFRTQHYQIMFYTLMLVLFMGIPPLYHLLKEKNWGAVGKVAGLSVGAVILTLLIVSQNLLSIKEYAPYSTRGGHAISLEETPQAEQEKKGVGFDYATNWSYSVSEWWNLIIPQFHGGTSNERYTGNAVPAWKGRELPTYWGTMPFTQSYEYLSVFLVFLAFVAILFLWHRWEVKSLTFLTILILLMSLGKNFAVLYRLFFYYVPYFDKFRVPMMILTLVMFNTALLAAFGLNFLLSADLSRSEIRNRFYTLSGIFGAILLIPLIFGSSFSLTHAGEVQRYGAQVVTELKKVRLEMLRDSTLRSLLFFILGIAAVFMVQQKWLKAAYLPVFLVVIIGLDLFLLDNNYVAGKFIDIKAAEQQQYRPNAADQAILKDKSLFRVFPVGRLFQDTHWSYYFQSLGGYSPAKLETIQEIVENNLYVKVGGPNSLNWNVIDMMNVKYLVVNQQLSSPHLRPIVADENNNLFAYENTAPLPRAFFVKTFRIIADGPERLKFINTTEFNPSEMAILEKQPVGQIQAPDSATVRITSWALDNIKLDVFSDKPALLVLSETYYPRGWKAFLDSSTETEVYKTDHLLRSVMVPAGNHTLEFRFHPESYYAGLRISLVSLLATYLLILLFLYLEYGKTIMAWFEKRQSGGK